MAIHEQPLAAVDGRRGVEAAERLCEACVVLLDIDAAAGLRTWAHFGTNVEGFRDHGSGRLIEHSLFVTTQRRTKLRADINELTDTD